MKFSLGSVVFCVRSIISCLASTRSPLIDDDIQLRQHLRKLRNSIVLMELILPLRFTRSKDRIVKPHNYKSCKLSSTALPNYSFKHLVYKKCLQIPLSEIASVTEAYYLYFHSNKLNCNAAAFNSHVEFCTKKYTTIDNVILCIIRCFFN